MIKELLLNKKSDIVNNWVQSIVETYPLETSNFLKIQKNRFSNPVGYVISNCAEKVIDEILNDCNIEKIKEALIDMIKVRAVQDFSPAEAVGFIFHLKRIINKELQQVSLDGKIFSEIMELESSIDNVALTAFELYTEAKEKVYQIRVNEIKSKMNQSFDGTTSSSV